MSRKYNTKHPDRSISNYPHRLKRRGLNKAPRMESIADLRKRQEKAGITPVLEPETKHAEQNIEGDESVA